MAYFFGGKLEYYAKMEVSIVLGGDYNHRVCQSIRPLVISSIRRIKHHAGNDNLHFFSSRNHRRSIWNCGVFGNFVSGHPNRGT